MHQQCSRDTWETPGGRASIHCAGSGGATTKFQRCPGVTIYGAMQHALPAGPAYAAATAPTSRPALRGLRPPPRPPGFAHSGTLMTGARRCQADYLACDLTAFAPALATRASCAPLPPEAFLSPPAPHGATWLPKNVFVRYPFARRRGGLPPDWIACQSDRDGAVSWSHAITIRNTKDARTSTVRTLNEGETI
jgi:hypothetical protein